MRYVKGKKSHILYKMKQNHSMLVLLVTFINFLILINSFSVVSSSNPPSSQIAQNEYSNLKNMRKYPISTHQIANKLNLTGNGTTIGFIDSGINIEHEVFSRFEGDIPYFASGDVIDPFEIQDVADHGTHVASIASGKSQSYSGIAPNASVVMINVFDQNDQQGTKESMVNGLQWLLENSESLGVDVLSISVGALALEKNLIIEEYVKNFTDRGICVVCSVGNFGNFGNTSILAPATSPYAISVGGLNTETFSYYDHTGRGPTDDGFQKPDITAPAVGIIGANSTDPIGYKKKTGVSQSTPMISGIISLLLEYANKMDIVLTWKNIKWLLSITALNVDGENHLRKMNHHNRLGWGLVQLKPIIDFLQKNSTEYTKTMNDSFCVQMGSKQDLCSKIIPISLQESINYEIRTNVSVGQMGVFRREPTMFGEPQLLKANKELSNSLLLDPDESDIHYLVLKVPKSTNLVNIEISIVRMNIKPFLFISLLFIIGFYGLSFWITSRSINLSES